MQGGAPAMIMIGCVQTAAWFISTMLSENNGVVQVLACEQSSVEVDGSTASHNTRQVGAKA